MGFDAWPVAVGVFWFLKRGVVIGMKFIMAKIFLISLTAGIAVNLPASESEVTAEHQVLNLLRGYEWQLDIEKLKGLPPGSEKILMTIFGAEKYPQYIRSRALGALAYFPTKGVWEFLQSELAGAAPIARRRIVDTLCQAFTAVRPIELESVIGEYLFQQDAHLRVTVARCLQGIGSDSSREKIHHYRSGMADSIKPWELDAIKR